MREKQTKKQSIIESIVNTLSGTIFSFFVSLLIYPLVGIKASVHDIGLLTIIFTIFSILKNFLVRRFFESEFWKRFVKKHKF